MKTPQKLTAILILSLGSIANAQVGINTLTPDTTAILHIYSNTKGVLLPTLDSAQRAPLTAPAADGLLVYDSVSKVYYFLNRTTGQWLALNPFQTTENHDESGNGGDDVRLAPRFQNRNVVIGGDTAAPGIKLHVKGNIKADHTVHAEKAHISDSLWSKKIASDSLKTGIANITTIHAPTVNVNNIRASTTSTINITSPVTATTIDATNINGRIPVGAIVMWDSSETIPPCWTIVTAMSGRFPVGVGTAGLGDGISYGRGAIRDNLLRTGANEVSLTPRQIPDHTHGTNTYDSNSGAGTNTNTTSFTRNNIPNGQSGSDGNRVARGGYRPAGPSVGADGEAHENRPPFYGIYFIKKTSNNCHH